MESFKNLILLIAIFGLSNGQIVSVGNCPEVNVQPEFDLDRYLGVWYENEKYPAIFQVGGKCTKAEYTALPNATVLVENTSVSTITGKPISIQGTATVVDNARLKVNFPNRKNSDANYIVLATDYDSYAVVYSCTNISKSRAEFAWILTRTRISSPALIEKARSIFSQNKIAVEHLQLSDQLGCFDEE